jgi:hypothetical protein
VSQIQAQQELFQRLVGRNKFEPQLDARLFALMPLFEGATELRLVQLHVQPPVQHRQHVNELVISEVERDLLHRYVY